ncbi:MAG: hypothetical protein GEU99_20935 [Luteitalea sp.]|nr:hypothetical protein [Luteitalea sp.]
MAEAQSPVRSGVTEVQASYSEALRVIGTQDQHGNHIGIVSVSGVRLRLVGLALRVLGLAVVVGLFFVRQPLNWLPIPDTAPATLVELRDWTLFSAGTWLLGLFWYVLYFAVAQFKSSVFVGQAGAEIHLARHKKIVDTVRYGEFRVVLDPRVYPLAVVSTKYFLLPAARVDATTKDNITLSHTGAFFVRVKDSFRLLVKGGFPRFLQQLEKLHASAIQEEALGIPATEFNRFLVDPVRIPSRQAGESITERLSTLEQSDLSVDSLTEMSEIDELDVSSFDLSEPQSPKRRAILPRLQQLAEDYGIEVVDYLPTKNTVPKEFLETLAVPLISSLTRLDQATEALKEIIGEEIEEEIVAKVSAKQLALLEIRKIIQEIKAVNDTLANDDNRQAIVYARTTAMKNLAEGLLATVLTKIEGLRATIRAKHIDTAGLERYFTEMDDLLSHLEQNVSRYVPALGTVIVDSVSSQELVPAIDIFDRVVEETGTKQALEILKREGEIDPEGLKAATEAIERQTDAIKIDGFMERIRSSLDEVRLDSGISTDAYQPDKVMARITEIEKDAGVTEAEPVATI